MGRKKTTIVTKDGHEMYECDLCGVLYPYRASKSKHMKGHKEEVLKGQLLKELLLVML
jgi:uncharacterized C2H2 Zn-finger protein